VARNTRTTQRCVKSDKSRLLWESNIVIHHTQTQHKVHTQTIWQLEGMWRADTRQQFVDRGTRAGKSGLGRETESCMKTLEVRKVLVFCFTLSLSFFCGCYSLSISLLQMQWLTQIRSTERELTCISGDVTSREVRCGRQTRRAPPSKPLWQTVRVSMWGGVPAREVAGGPGFTGAESPWLLTFSRSFSIALKPSKYSWLAQFDQSLTVIRSKGAAIPDPYP